MSRSNPLQVGIALGSGGALGWAHVGVLRALADHGIKPRMASGSSMGALVGGVYAAGTLDVLHEFALELDWKEALLYFVELNIPRSGIVEGERIVAFVRKNIVHSKFSDLACPFRAVATDLFSGEEIVLKDGDIIEAIRASISIPGIFTPVRSGQRWLVDGGLSNPVPVSVVRDMGADIVIAVDVTALGTASSRNSGARTAQPDANAPAAVSGAKKDGHPLLAQLRHNLSLGSEGRLPRALRRWWEKDSEINLFDVLGQSARIIEARISEARLQTDPPDVLLQPAVGHVNFMEFHRAPEAIDAGYRAAEEKMDAIKKACRNRGELPKVV